MRRQPTLASLGVGWVCLLGALGELRAQDTLKLPVSVQLLTFADAGSSGSILVTPAEMMDLLLQPLARDQDLSVRLLSPTEYEKLSADQRADIVVSGFYLLQDQKLLLNAQVDLRRTGVSMVRPLTAGDLEQLRNGLRDLLRSKLRTLALTSQPPGASLRLDGRELQATTPITLVNLLEGKHELQLSRDGHATLLHAFECCAESASLELSLPVAATPSPTQEPTPASTPTETPPPKPQGFGYLKFKKSPWAEIYVDGKLQGDTANVQKLKVAAGSHQILLDSPERGKKTITLEVQEDQTHVVAY